MIIAVSSSGKKICEHFGHCENFNLFEVKDGVITSEQSVPNPGHKPGFLPNFLADMGVTVVVAGGMGGGAVTIFEERGVEVVAGASGYARDAVERFLKGELKSTGAVCHEHEMGKHGGKC